MRLVSLLGVVLLLGLCIALSRNRAAISWRLVAVGLSIQLGLGLAFVFWEPGSQLLYRVGQGAKAFLDLSSAGSEFVFGALAKAEAVDAAFVDEPGFVLALQVLPTVIFFSSFMAVLYHLGVMQWIVRGMAVVMARLLGTSGAESLSACGNIFVGCTEAPLLVRPFLSGMTRSELHAVMTGGFATIAGGVFALYVMFGMNPGHLIVASVMAAPTGVVVSKILWPETETPQTRGRVTVHVERSATNVVEAAAAGALDGLKLALNIAAMLIAFLSLIAVLDLVLGAVGGWIDIELSVGRLLSWVFWPVAAVMGVAWEEVPRLAELLGTRIAVTELIAYKELGAWVEAREISPRATMIATFALCGFASVGTLAIQIGGLGAMAPDRKRDFASLGLRAMFAGAITTCLNACVVGALRYEWSAQ